MPAKAEKVLRIFISYSRDSEEHADRVLALADSLRRDGIDAMLDQYEPDPSEGLPRWMERNIREADLVLMICTENYSRHIVSEEASGSDREAAWQGRLIYNYLYTAGGINTKFIPVLFDDETVIPAPARGFRSYLLPADYQALYRRITGQPLTPAPELGERKHLPARSRPTATYGDPRTAPLRPAHGPFMAADLPEGYIERPGEFAALKSLLLARDRSAPVAITTAIAGAGGFGKTMLALALCHDHGIIETFHDGILWVTLGKTPDIVGGLTKLYAALTHDRSHFIDAEDAATNLAQILDSRACLIVIDDVWNSAHLSPFLRGGQECVRLVTTRDSRVTSTNTGHVEVSEMTSRESVSLLRGHLDRLSLRDAATLESHRPSISTIPDSEFQALAVSLGEWPLLLDLAGAFLARKTRDYQGDTARALRYVREALARKGPIAFDLANGEDRRKAVRLSLDASLTLLDEVERRRYCELAIFSEDVSIPLTVAADLWSLDEFDAEEQAARLADLSLLAFDGGHGTLRLHDLIRDYLRRSLVDAPAVHARLLDTWGDLQNCPHPYAWNSVPYHLVQANRADALRSLLLDFNWIRGMLRNAGIAPLIAAYDCLANDEAVGLVQDALRLSAHVLAVHPEQLPGQLWGRLVGLASTAIQEILAASGRSAEPRLRPITGSLTPPGAGLLRIFMGHSSLVNGVAVSPDGRYGASGSSDGTARIWDLTTGLATVLQNEDEATINAVVFTPDGKYLLTGSVDATVREWDSKTGVEMAVFKGHEAAVCAVVVTPDGRRAVSGAEDNTIRIWDLDSGSLVRTLIGHRDWVYSVALTSDGCQVFSGSRDRTVRIWDLETGALLQTIDGFNSSVTSIAVTPDGRLAVIAQYAHGIQTRDLETGTLLSHHPGVMNADTRVAIVPGRRTVLSGLHESEAEVWDLDTGATLTTLTGHSRQVIGVAATPDGRRALTSSWDGSVRLWNIGSSAVKQARARHKEYVTAIVFHPDGKRVITAGLDGVLLLWDASSGKLKRKMQGHGWAVEVLTLTPDGTRVLSGSWDNTLRLWNLATGEPLHIFAGHTGHIRAAAISPDGSRAVSASEDGTLLVWDLQTGAAIHTLSGHTKTVTTVALFHNGRNAISGSLDRTARIWDIETGRQTHLLRGHANDVEGVAVLPGEKRALTACWDGTIRIWNLESGAIVDTMSSNQDSLIALAVDPRGERVVAPSRDRDVVIWDLKTRQLIQRIQHSRATVHPAVFTSDGRRLLCASSQTALGLWDLELGRWIAEFTADTNLYAYAISSDGGKIVAGDVKGNVYHLHVENL